ncbi:MAG TPA: hypothetical protein VGK46_05390 [Saprospiraceae bacterium]|jgi:hypothetical protein
MEILKLNARPGMFLDIKLKHEFDAFEKMILELEKRQLPSSILILINQDIKDLNDFAGPSKAFAVEISKKRNGILQILSRDLKLVPRNHYRNVWLAMGMMIFGVPFGMMLGTVLGNLALFPIGLPMGLILGIMVGTSLDKKAFENGRQLDIVLKS